MRPLYLLIVLCLTMYSGYAQPKSYTTNNAHSHNDYEQKYPFYAAFEAGFGSIEADIHLVNGKILVGHDAIKLNDSNTLARLYLNPLSEKLNNNTQLQLLIDIKTEALSTLNALIILLETYPDIVHHKGIRIVISGNRPTEEAYKQYPAFIWFDGRLGKAYTKTALKKIGLLSESCYTFIKSKNPWPLKASDENNIKLAIEQGHSMKKPVRLWATPDNKVTWEKMMQIKVDFINTDHIQDLATFLNNQ